MRVITGAPSYFYYMSAYTVSNIWQTIDSALKRGFNVGCDTSGFTAFGLASSHAYHIIGTY
jgi:hypothetical protein